MVGLSHRWLVAAAWLVCLVVVPIVLGRLSDRSVQALVIAAYFISLVVIPIVLGRRALKENPKHGQAWLGIILSWIAIILWISHRGHLLHPLSYSRQAS